MSPHPQRQPREANSARPGQGLPALLLGPSPCPGRAQAPSSDAFPHSPNSAISHMAEIHLIHSSSTCLGRHLSRHDCSTSSATVPLCLLQSWTWSLPPSFIPKIVRTSPSVDHSFSIISQLIRWQWLSILWGASKDCSAYQESCWRVHCERLKGASRICLERTPSPRKQKEVQKLKEDNDSISAGSSNLWE